MPEITNDGKLFFDKNRSRLVAYRAAVFGSDRNDAPPLQSPGK